MFGDGFPDVYTESKVPHERMSSEIGNIKVRKPAGFDDDLELPVHVRRDVKVDGSVGPFFVSGWNDEGVYVVKRYFPQFRVSVLKRYTVVS